ncbi:MAG: hypothetical protein L6R40_000504 [Gallowayella cf. fulva]|nr:MAG: hypothetical protein L6R40_000504 [Xanthomendoza cf. fulva]
MMELDSDLEHMAHCGESVAMGMFLGRHYEGIQYPALEVKKQEEGRIVKPRCREQPSLWQTGREGSQKTRKITVVDVRSVASLLAQLRALREAAFHRVVGTSSPWPAQYIPQAPRFWIALYHDDRMLQLPEVMEAEKLRSHVGSLTRRLRVVRSVVPTLDSGIGSITAGNVGGSTLTLPWVVVKRLDSAILVSLIQILCLIYHLKALIEQQSTPSRGHHSIDLNHQTMPRLPKSHLDHLQPDKALTDVDYYPLTTGTVLLARLLGLERRKRSCRLPPNYSSLYGSVPNGSLHERNHDSMLPSALHLRHRHHASASNVPSPSRYRSLSDTFHSSLATPRPLPRQQAPQPQLREEDECPICHHALPPKGPEGGETTREAHVASCIEQHFSSSVPRAARPHPSVATEAAVAASGAIATSGWDRGGGNTQQRHDQRTGNERVEQSSSSSNNAFPRTSSQKRRGVGMFKYLATEKDCIAEGGEPAECVICFEEFEQGVEMGRLECLCKFHKPSSAVLVTPMIFDWWKSRPGMPRSCQEVAKKIDFGRRENFTLLHHSLANIGVV